MTPLDHMSTEKILAARFAKKFTNEHDFAFFKTLSETFPQAELYLVGGMVRDVVMDQHGSKDYDFVLRYVPADALIAALKPLGFVDLVGRTFGVIKFMPHHSDLKEAIDIALPRTERAEGTGGYKDVETQSDPTLPVETDLSRRDLTINAMAWDIKHQRLIDPFKGQQDIENQLIRCVGNARERFQEDYSRMLRAIRFACKFDYAIADDTWQAMRELMPHLADEQVNKDGKRERVVPMEIITREMSKAFSLQPLKAFDLFDQSRAWEVLLPDIVPVKRDENAWDTLRAQIAVAQTDDFREEFNVKNVDPALLYSLISLSLPKGERTGRAYNTYLKATSQHFRLTKEHGEFISRLPENITAATGNPSLTTLEKLFFNSMSPLLLQILSLRTVTAEAAVDPTPYDSLVLKLKPLLLLAHENGGKLPTELLDGAEIMKLLGMSKGGNIVSQVKDALREEQLAGKLKTAQDATNWVILHRDRFRVYS